MKSYSSLAKRVLPLLMFAVTMVSVTSCQDKVDSSDMYSFSGKQMIDFLRTNESTTYFAYLTTKVKLSSKSPSTVADVLSARGNYTCFAPSNEAVQHYLDSVYNTTGYDYTATPDSMAEQIVNNSIIDHKNADAYLSSQFEVGTISLPTFSDRYLTVRFDTINNGHLAIYINTYSRIISADNEVENGIVHVVNHVVTTSNSTLPEMIGNTDNLKTFYHLLTLTGWDKKMREFRDLDYENNHPEEGQGVPTEHTPIPCPSHRDKGYTAFCEPDSVYQLKWNLPEYKYLENGDVGNWDEIMPIIEEKCKEYYPNATSSDPTSTDNALNQFVAYHLLGVGLTYDHIVIHYNERGCGYSTPLLGIDSWEYYETMGPQHRILKVTEGSQTQGKRINRYVSERDLSNYKEITVPRPGILINESNGGREYNALNGYYYTINDILVYDDDVPNKVLNERMRYDVCSMLPEMISNNLRRSYTTEDQYNIPRGYFDNLTFTGESNVVYLNGYARSWRNYQGDEFNVQGAYDVTLKLPHVPVAGTYQLRYGTQNTDVRSMVQFYFGTNKDHLEACGLPVDMRISGEMPHIGWVADGTDADINEENDRAMYIHGYMKAPLYYGTNNKSGVGNSFRTDPKVYRRIVTTVDMDPQKDYYIRMKSVLESTTRQLFIDYFELVPKSVYANDLVAEDKW
jgi:uncharacterized surface protein with fasciclin (FAS1) repeats